MTIPNPNYSIPDHLNPNQDELTIPDPNLQFTAPNYSNSNFKSR